MTKKQIYAIIIYPFLNNKISNSEGEHREPRNRLSDQLGPHRHDAAGPAFRQSPGQRIADPRHQSAVHLLAGLLLPEVGQQRRHASDADNFSQPLWEWSRGLVVDSLLRHWNVRDQKIRHHVHVFNAQTGLGISCDGRNQSRWCHPSGLFLPLCQYHQHHRVHNDSVPWQPHQNRLDHILCRPHHLCHQLVQRCEVGQLRSTQVVLIPSSRSFTPPARASVSGGFNFI